jgi:glutathione-regulated potassium-efflux system ancillary protein KefG
VLLHRRGRFVFVYDGRLLRLSDGSVYQGRLVHVTPFVQTDDLIDAQLVADTLCLSHRNSVSLYQRRYADMPRPVVELGGGRIKLWLRSEIELWATAHASRARPRRHRRSAC